LFILIKTGLTMWQFLISFLFMRGHFLVLLMLHDIAV
jgi:hypothetical protein